MNSHHRSHDLARLVFGLAVLAVGLLFILNNLGIGNAHHYLRYWPVVLIAFGLARLFQPRHGGGRFWGLFVGCFGALLLLRNLRIIDFSVWALWPILLVVLGLSIIGHSFGRRPRSRLRGDGPFPPPRTTSTESDESVIDDSVVFGGSERSNSSQDFRGGRISVIMGGYEIDLRGASMASGEALLDISAICSGVEIKVPEDWNVVLKGTPVLGGVNNQTRKQGPGAKNLVIVAHVVLGGVEVRN